MPKVRWIIEAEIPDDVEAFGMDPRFQEAAAEQILNLLKERLRLIEWKVTPGPLFLSIDEAQRKLRELSADPAKTAEELRDGMAEILILCDPEDLARAGIV